MTFQLPRYQSASIADLLPSVCDGLRVPGAWDIVGLGEADRVVVLVIDGLGWQQLRDHAELAPHLAGCSQLTTVSPSTTAAALTSLGTGLPPGRHGVVGASFWLPDRGLTLYPLQWRKDVPVASVAPEPTWWQRAARAGVGVTAVSPRPYHDSGLTKASLGGAGLRGADGPGERVAEIAAAARAGERTLVYGYWEALDKAGHVHGVDSAHYRAELVAADRWVAQVADALPPGTRLIVTADHGMVDCDHAVDLDADADLLDGVRLIAGEPRLRHVYTEPGMRDEVAAVWADTLADDAVVVTREQLLTAGYFGDVAADVAARVGDVVALATGTTKLTAASRDSIVSGLRGQHGSLTPAEMLVPLVILDC